MLGGGKWKLLFKGPGPWGGGGRSPNFLKGSRIVYCGRWAKSIFTPRGSGLNKT